MQKFARIAEILTKVTGGTFYVHPVHYNILTHSLPSCLLNVLGTSPTKYETSSVAQKYVASCSQSCTRVGSIRGSGTVRLGGSGQEIYKYWWIGSGWVQFS